MTIPVPWRSSYAAVWVWLGCLVGWGAWSGSLIAAALTVPVVAVFLVDRRLGVGALACLVLGMAATSAWWWHERAPPLLTLASERQTVTVRAELLTNPDVSRREHLGERPQSRVTARIREVQAGPQRFRARGTLTAFLDPVQTDDWTRGTQVRLTGRLGVGSWWRDPVLTMQVREAGVIQAPTGGSRLLAHARERMWGALGAGDGPALIAGLAVGDDSRQSPALARAMRDSGLSHLTAVSGGNIAIVVGVVVGLITLLGLGIRWRIFGGIGAVLGYAYVVGPEPSVLRAGVMGSVALAAILLRRQSSGMPLLGGAVLGLLLVRPQLAISWGFALSVSATAGIVLLAPILLRHAAQRWPRVPPTVLLAAAVTLSAQVATAPLLGAMVGQLSLAAIPANLAAAALVVPITVLGLGILLVGLVSPALAAVLAAIAQPFGDLLATIAHVSARIPGAVVSLPDGIEGALMVTAVLVVLGVGWQRGRFTATVALLVVVAVFAAALPRPRDIPADWIAVACDVGQGDAYLIRSGAGSAILIDTGPKWDALQQCLHQAEVQQLAMLILTHFDTDHVAALPQLVREQGVQQAVVSPVELPESNARSAIELLRHHQVPTSTAQPGQRWRVGTATVEVLWPRRLIADGSASNNAAVATEVSVAGLNLLFTGDLEPLGQAGLMAAQPAGQFDVTTIPHHGSANQHPEFLSWTGASLAWVSAGRDNKFGHPRPEALALARQSGAVVGRTDQDGTLAIVSTRLGPRLVRGGRERGRWDDA